MMLSQSEKVTERGGTRVEALEYNKRNKQTRVQRRNNRGRLAGSTHVFYGGLVLVCFVTSSAPSKNGREGEKRRDAF